MKTPFETYLAEIGSIYRHGNATEHTYRPALHVLLEVLAPGVRASNDPKHIACGAPDFIVERGSVPLGYVETNDIGDDLNKIEEGEQLGRYRLALNNLILTDYLEFRWYVSGKFKLGARLASIGKAGKLIPDMAGLATVAQLFNEFYQTQVPTVGSPKELARRMAQQAKLVSSLITNALQAEDAINGALHRQYDAFRQHLLPALKPQEFADLYAQTMAYGLFAARLSAPADAIFSRAAAYQYLTSNRFLRKLFLDVGEELDGTPIAPFLDDIASLLAHADMAAILQDFGKRTRTEDPVVHFYETFLAQYNPKLRKSRGVFYTPEPAVQFIVHSIDWLLQERFACPMGLAGPDVYLLDPATGTGTFLYFVIQAIYETLIAHGQGGTWPGYVREKLLPRLYGFELLMAPYVIAHLKLGLLLKELGFQPGKEDRLRIYLTNTLDEGVTASETLGDLGWYISQEASDAAQVKVGAPIMVVLGNPPYSNYGMLNKNDWIRGLLEDYKRGLNEKKINLDDDFIKFIRFGQWRIDRTGQGILAFITNNTFIDGITHRQMRRSLMETFTDIYILDLHGSSKKKEKAPDGSKDENVFDIQQGVAISLFIKEPGKHGPARVHHAELWGTREDKYEVLSRESVATMPWVDLEPKGEQFFFVPKDFSAKIEYQTAWSIANIYIEHNTGIQTKRDNLFIDFEKETLAHRFRDISLHSKEIEYLRTQYGLEDSSGWSISRLSGLKYRHEAIVQVFYRPFDLRWLYFDTKALGRARETTMRHMIQGNNIGLITLRINGNGDDFVCLATQNAIEKGSLPRGNYSLFPLYLYSTPSSTADTLFAQIETVRVPNLASAFIATCTKTLGLAFVPDGTGDLVSTYGPEDVFHYAYAVFHSPTYRARYAELLKIDFPRLPLTADRALFAALAAKGEELVGLHLLKSPALDNTITSYPVQGNNAVEKVQYASERVWINSTQYFGGIPEEVWTFRIGGYQVCDKWLKDRKGRLLSGDEIMHYQRVIVALKETMRLMEEIDRVILSWPIT